MYRTHPTDTDCSATCWSRRQGLTRSQILDHVWDYDFGVTASVLET